MNEAPGVKAYVAVTAAYWAFMLTDGALRMLVLLHFHILGFSPVQLAYLFLLYEFMGMVTNLSAGWLAARFGLTSTLYAGLALQVVALLALSALDPGWQITASVIFVMAVQGVSGIAKDLAKMSSKSAVKLLAPAEGNSLFRWVAILTGSKNAIKGLGFFLGTALLAVFGFTASVFAMAAILTVILVAVVVFMPAGLPAGVKGTKASAIWPKDRNILSLSLARVFLFAARDSWFVVGIPVFFYGVLSDGTPESARRAFLLIGAFMAVWIILYGLVQATAPKLLSGNADDVSGTIQAAQRWVCWLMVVPALLTVALLINPIGLIWIVVVGLLIFGVIFALNSALHSYLILAFSKSERVTMDVGFYYMANASGRLLGTLLSGVSYQAGGVAACLAATTVLTALSWMSARQLR